WLARCRQTENDSYEQQQRAVKKSHLEDGDVWRKLQIAAGNSRRMSDVTLRHLMPSFDIVSEVDKQEVDNALNQARKEVSSRFDLKDAKTEIIQEKDRIVLTAADAAHLKSLREIAIGKLSKRAVDLRNIEQVEPEISSVGHARQE